MEDIIVDDTMATMPPATKVLMAARKPLDASFKKT